MINRHNKRLNNISIIFFEIFIAIITFGVIDNYDGEVEKTFLTYILSFVLLGLS